MNKTGLTINWENLSVSELCDLGYTVTVDGDCKTVVFMNAKEE